MAEHAAAKYGVEKRELLNPEAGDLAVRMALAETSIVAETKESLAEMGVDVAALEAFAMKRGAEEGRKRSSRVILVKNLTATASEGDISAMFGKFGGLGRVVLPSTATMALVRTAGGRTERGGGI